MGEKSLAFPESITIATNGATMLRPCETLRRLPATIATIAWTIGAMIGGKTGKDAGGGGDDDEGGGSRFRHC